QDADATLAPSFTRKVDKVRLGSCIRSTATWAARRVFGARGGVAGGPAASRGQPPRNSGSHARLGRGCLSAPDSRSYPTLACTAGVRQAVFTPGVLAVRSHCLRAAEQPAAARSRRGDRTGSGAGAGGVRSLPPPVRPPDPLRCYLEGAGTGGRRSDRDHLTFCHWNAQFRPDRVTAPVDPVRLRPHPRPP